MIHEGVMVVHEGVMVVHEGVMVVHDGVIVVGERIKQKIYSNLIWRVVVCYGNIAARSAAAK